MQLPFSVQQFLEVFKEYNVAVWPMQLFFYLLAVLSIYAIIKRWHKLVAAILAFFWLWMGIVYHLVYFSAINKAAYFFGAAFIVEAALFVYFGMVRQQLQFRLSGNIYGLMGRLLLFFALILYPVLGYLQGHIYPLAPSFGLPCPTTIFTLGLCLFTDKKLPPGLIIIPLAWSVIGFTASFSLGIREDVGLLVAAVLFVFLMVCKARDRRKMGLIKNTGM